MILFHQEDVPIQVVGPQPEPDLILGIGQFFVSPEGVTAKFVPPLSKLSDFYTWRRWPFALSATRSLVKGEDGSILRRLSDRIGLSIIEMDMLNLEPAEQPPVDSSNCLRSAEADADALVTWSSGLVERCPVEEVSDVLIRLAQMDMREVDRYVETFLGAFL